MITMSKYFENLKDSYKEALFVQSQSDTRYVFTPAGAAYNYCEPPYWASEAEISAYERAESYFDKWLQTDAATEEIIVKEFKKKFGW